MGGSKKGFVNARTGAYVSPERAHQHVGESIRGIKKAKSQKTGNFYMREDDEDGFVAAVTTYAGILSRDGRSGQK